jgi:hypothetical protein
MYVVVKVKHIRDRAGKKAGEKVDY